ncbi:beta-1,3-galactosyltransferase 2-like isoform X2 [Hyla sarda]|uniref:beta-1,3-galactosyltransferase 2-like isoform X2 n=1 Tax=Hyla sarda TaxID=327740 RepID=UPI0024C3F95F|nr:beta-1,3-galactosyltransferase 2-like isoform X2 [Hyla sarda]
MAPSSRFYTPTGDIMIRLNTWKTFKLCLISVACLTMLSVFDGGDIILDTWTWFQQNLLYSFTSHIIILNSSSSAIHHRQALPYPHPYRFLINQPNKCLARSPFLVLLVVGDTHNVKSRDIIRTTWGNVSNYGDIDIVSLFLVGISPVMTSAIQNLLEEESTVYGDIVQQDFLDSYNNLTLKTLMGMEWITKFCPNASYVMKVDSDVFLNVDYLVHQLLHPEFPPQTNFLTGYIVFNSGPIRIKNSKWYISEEVYPGNIYPPYPSGPAYVFSADIAKKIYKVAQDLLVFGIEDAFIGICLYKLNILPTTAPKYVFHGQKIDYDPCRFSSLVMVHHYKDIELKNIWEDFWGKRTFKC